MSGVVTFDYATWAARYPELAASVDEALATLYFGEATLYLDNSAQSVVRDLTARAALLNMLTAHIAKLNATIGGQPPSGLVGRVASASEGSVSVSTDAGAIPGTAAYFAQTQYGMSFWAATARYRTARYIPGPRPYLGVSPWGGYR